MDQVMNVRSESEIARTRMTNTMFMVVHFRQLKWTTM